MALDICFYEKYLENQGISCWYCGWIYQGFTRTAYIAIILWSYGSIVCEAYGVAFDTRDIYLLQYDSLL
jgi:hypothetical protein